MANISIRKIDDDIYERLQLRAATHGVSMEEEVRQILKRTVSAPDRLGDLAIESFGDNNGVELILPTHKSHDPITFS